MELKLSEDVLEDIKSIAIKEAKEKLTEALINELLSNKEQIKKEIRNEVIKDCSKQLANRIETHYRIKESVEKTLSSVEGRINKIVKDKLESGITVKFNGK